VEALGIWVTGVRLKRPAEAQNVLEASGRDDAYAPFSLSLKETVQHERARVDGGGQAPGGGPDVAVQVGDGILKRPQHALRLVVRCGLRLPDGKPPVLQHHKGVGHRSTGVDSEHPRFGHLASPNGRMSTRRSREEFDIVM
jgi:hypothetical protein